MVQEAGDRSYSLVPSSETIPRPSALFCLSNAFRSRTLHTHGHTHTLVQTSHRACAVKEPSKRPTGNLRTCRSASGTERWGRSRHPFYPSDSPAFSANTETWKRFRCCSSSQMFVFVFRWSSHLLHIAVASIEDRDAQFERGGNHCPGLAWNGQ